MEFFHHPRFSFPVVGRKVTEELLALTEVYLKFVATGGRSLMWDSTFPDPTAYRMAMHRLRRAGLVAYVIDGKHQVLHLTDEGRGRLPDYHAPQRRWNTSWNGRWYVLMYDVPEKHRSNRYALRQFLKQLGLGCLQKSVWVTPRDIRPEYSDLEKAACISDYAVLFEARTVLGYRDKEIARRAWNFDTLHEAQAAYRLTAERQIARIRKGRLSPPELEQLGREEMQAFISVMQRDPLLPKALHPPGYLGPTAFQLHRRVVKALGTALAIRP